VVIGLQRRGRLLNPLRVDGPRQKASTMSVLCHRCVVILSLAALLFVATPASAATIGLATALRGSNAGVASIDLAVDFDPNGSIATNLVGVELFVEFVGLSPIARSYDLFAPGSVFGPYQAEVIESHGVCADVGPCNYPPNDDMSASHYLSFAAVFAPFQPSGPGGLFTLSFRPTGDAEWSLNLFGLQSDGTNGALLWDPPCNVVDPTCLGGAVPFEFTIVRPGDDVRGGTARLDVSATVNAQVVPEPSVLLLVGGGLLALARRHRRR